ncbi:MAG TPA: transcription antitermination factor NusB, partial [Gammaproteobacteria bacterium]|nr:transcription antitermination factor NusB [Gammaproteobacteria bacterium]
HHGARGRSRARRLAMQGLYQWQMGTDAAAEIGAQLRLSREARGTDLDYFDDLLHNIITGHAELAAAFEPHLDRPAEQLDPIERAILLLGTYELRARMDVPYRVVLNEAVELARDFGAEDSHKYINAVLDRAAASLRAPEKQVRARSG